MIKWLKRIVLALISLVLVLILLFVIIKPRAYFIVKSIVGSGLQIYGYDKVGDEMIEESIGDLKGLSASQYHATSIQYTKNGIYDKAIVYLDKASELEPHNADGYYGWVLLYYYRDYKKALFHLNRYDAFTPDFHDRVGDDNILYAKALCYKEMGQYPKALELFESAIASELKEHKQDESWISHQLYFQKARTLHLLDEQEKAIEYYDNTLRLWEKSSESFYYKGLAQIDLGDSVSGHENLKTALELVKKGYKTTDTYVSLFDEVYQREIEKALKDIYSETQ